MNGWDRFADSFLNARVAAEYTPKIIEGLWLTLALAGCIIAAGVLAGLALAVLRAMGLRPVNWVIIFAVDLFRALPPLVIIVLLYFGLPAAGIAMSGFIAAWLALSLVLMAFAEEIFWAGITAIPTGQWEASRSLGLGFIVTFGLIILPQALRMVIPPLVNRTIAITKGTALASVVAVPEILGAAQAGVSFSFNPTPLTLGAVAYLVLFLPVVVAGRWVEQYYRVRR